METLAPTRRNAPRVRPALDWREALSRLIGYGTRAYPPATRRRLQLMNITAYCVAAFTAIYTVQQSLHDFQAWKPVILINLGLIAVALSVPFLHRFGELAGVLTLGISENIALFVLTYYLGRDSGPHTQYVVAICVYFVVMGIERLRLIIALAAGGFALHILAWALFPQEWAVLAVSPSQSSMLYITAVGTTFTIVVVVLSYAFQLAKSAEEQNEALLHNMLPGPIVDRLKANPKGVIADEFAEGSVLFADLKGFVPLARRLGPAGSVELLNIIVSEFDKLADHWGVEKIKTIGDCYMIAAGVPEPTADHAARIGSMALAMHETLARISRVQEIELTLRIGIATGPILAGVIGAKRLTYDVWGDTVNLAARLEGLSEPGRVLVSQPTRARLEPRYALERLGPIEIKGFGVEETWYLVGVRDPLAGGSVEGV